MRARLRPRLIVVGILLAAAGVILIFLSYRPREAVQTIAPGVHLVRGAQASSWELLVDASGVASDGPKGGTEAEQVTQYGVLADGRLVVEGRVDGTASWLVIGADEESTEGRTVLAVFPSHATLEDYLRRQSATPPLMRSVSAAEGAGAAARPFWGGIACLGVGMGLLVLGMLLRPGEKGAKVSQATTRRPPPRPSRR